MFSLGLGSQGPSLSSGRGSHVGSSLLLGRLGGEGLSWGRPRWKGQWPFRGSPHWGPRLLGSRPCHVSTGGGGWRHAGRTTSCPVSPSLIPTGV